MSHTVMPEEQVSLQALTHSLMRHACALAYATLSEEEEQSLRETVARELLRQSRGVRTTGTTLGRWFEYLQ